MHAAEMHSDEFIAGKRFDFLPDKLRGVFDRHKSDLEKEREEVRRKMKRMRDEWNEGGGEKRGQMEIDWIHQLENDEAWDTGQEARQQAMGIVLRGNESTYRQHG